MSGFDDRKNAFENKFKHDEELKFKVTTRRAKLLGLWAAEQMGLSGTDAEQYAKAAVMADMAEAGDADLIRKVKADLEAKNVNVSDHRIEKKLEELLGVAKQQVMEGR